MQEENIFIRKRAKTWQRSRLLTQKQLQIVWERTNPYLTETSLFFRLLFFFFTSVCVLAAVGALLLPAFGGNEIQIGYIFLFFSIPTYGLAEYVVQTYHFYRYGIEEALALMSLVCLCGGLVMIIFPKIWENEQGIIISLAVSSCVFGYWLYLRFGFWYAALISTASLSILPFQFSLAPVWERILLVLMLSLLFLISLQTETAAMEDFRKKRKGVIQACLFAGIYLAINVRIFEVAESWFDQTPPHLVPHAGLPPEAYWFSYALTFLVPIWGLFLATKTRKRALMNAAGITLALSLATNKDYLGLTHYSWDPIIFGATLIGAAVLMIRWLARGKNKECYGFTAESILKPERYGLSLPEIGAAVMPGMTMAASEAPPAESSPFEGGQSGGGGASRNF